MSSSENQIKNIVQDITKSINEDMKDFTPLRSICEKYNRQPAHVVLAFAGTVLILTSLGLFQNTLITLATFIYPVYMSFQAIREQSDGSCTFWLTFWVLFAFLTAFDKIIAVVLFFIPSYYFLKLIFYVWLFYPKTKGAQIIYDKFIKSHLNRLKELSHKKYD